MSESLQAQYNNYQSTINEVTQKINQLKTDEEEHKIVIETLSNTPKDRKCFRMVGGALIEKNVEETLPVLQIKLDNMQKMIAKLTENLQKVVEEFEVWKKEKKIKIVKQ